MAQLLCWHKVARLRDAPGGPRATDAALRRRSGRTDSGEHAGGFTRQRLQRGIDTSRGRDGFPRPKGIVARLARSSFGRNRSIATVTAPASNRSPPVMGPEVGTYRHGGLLFRVPTLFLQKVGTLFGGCQIGARKR